MPDQRSQIKWAAATERSQVITWEIKAEDKIGQYDVNSYF